MGKKIEKLKSLIKGRDMMDEKKYAKLEKEISPKTPLMRNIIFAFLDGRNNLFNWSICFSILYDIF